MIRILIATLLMTPALACAAVQASFEIKDFSFEGLNQAGQPSGFNSDWRWSGQRLVVAAAGTSLVNNYYGIWTPETNFEMGLQTGGASAQLRTTPGQHYSGSSAEVSASDGTTASVITSHLGTLNGLNFSGGVVRFFSTMNLSGFVTDPLNEYYELNLEFSFFRGSNSEPRPPGVYPETYYLNTSHFNIGEDQSFYIDLDFGNFREATYSLSWSLNAVAIGAVSEPSGYAMLGLGLGVLGCATVRRKRQLS